MIRKNILLKRRIGCLLAATLLAGEISSASAVAVAAPIKSTQTVVENQADENQKVVDIPEEYITFGETSLSEPEEQTQELDAAKIGTDEEMQTQIPVLKPDTTMESLDNAEDNAEIEEKQNGETSIVDFPETIPVLGGNSQLAETERLATAGSDTPVATPGEDSVVTETGSDEGNSEDSTPGEDFGVTETGSDEGNSEDSTPGEDSVVTAPGDTNSEDSTPGEDSGVTAPGDTNSDGNVSEAPSIQTPEPGFDLPDPLPTPTPSTPMDPNNPNAGEVTISYTPLQIDDVISQSVHNGTTQTQYFSFTPETSGYYGFDALTTSSCSPYIVIESENNMVLSNVLETGSCSSFYFEEGITYKIRLQMSWYSTEYSYEIKFVSLDEIVLTDTETKASIGQRAVFKIHDKNTLYRVKVDSANGFDYRLYDSNGSGTYITLKNGEANAFFYSGYGPLCLKKDVEAEDEVTITLEQVPVSEYNLANETQKVESYCIKREYHQGSYSQEYYSFVSVTADESGTYTIATENASNINTYLYNEETQQLESTYVDRLSANNGIICSLESGKTYYFLLCQYGMNNEDKDTTTVKLQKQDYIQQEVGTTVTYSGKSMIPLSIDVEKGKVYRIVVEKTLEDTYYYCTDNFTTSMTPSCALSGTKTAITDLATKDKTKVVLSKYGKFDNLGDVVVTIEECDIPLLQKEVLNRNQNQLYENETYVTKFVPDETSVYELTGVRYDRWWANAYIYEEFTNSLGNVWLNCVGSQSYTDSSFTMQHEFKAGTTYYITTTTNIKTDVNDICFYLSTPKNYDMNVSESEEETTSLDMEILKAANVRVNIPKSGFYELSAVGGEEHYQIKSAGMDEGLALYKDQSKLAYFSAPGTYTVSISREFLPEDTLDPLSFSIKKSSSIENMSVYDGTEQTETELTLRESGDYAWFCFTPQEDGFYSLHENSHEGDYGSFSQYIYELKGDCLEYILYSNKLYELQAGKKYYVKVKTDDFEGANSHLVFIKNSQVEMSLDQHVSVSTSYGIGAKTTIAEKGLYKLTLTLTGKSKLGVAMDAGNSTYRLTCKVGKPISKILYLDEGEQTFFIRNQKNTLNPAQFDLQLEKVNVQENMQSIPMDESTVWVKYVPSESQRCFINATCDDGIYVTPYYEANNRLYSDMIDNLSVNNKFYGIYDFKKDVTYYLELTSETVPQQVGLQITPVHEVSSSSLAGTTVDVQGCTEIIFDEAIQGAYYELKVSGNTSPLRTKLNCADSYYSRSFTNLFDTNGGSRLVKLDEYLFASGEAKFSMVLINLGDEETAATVEINEIVPTATEISLNETFTKTVNNLIEAYTFTPDETGYYQFDIKGTEDMYFYGTNQWYFGEIYSGECCTLEAGKTYTFYLEEKKGTEFSITIQKARKLYLYDYEECSAFIASGGSITLMNEGEVPQNVLDDYDDEYSDIRTLGNGKVLVFRSDSFKNMNERWYPQYLNSVYVKDSDTTYGDLEQYVDKKYYYGKVYESLYNDKLEKIKLTDTMSNPHMVTVRYVPEYVAVQEIKLSGTTVMKVGETATLTAVLDTMNQYKPNDPTVTWSSSDSNVIAVNEKGVITAKGAGTATITVKSNDRLGKAATITIQVHQDVVYADTVTISGSQSVDVGESVQLTAAVTAKNGEPTEKGVIWSTSDPTIATVDNGGKVNGLKQGTVIISATSKDQKANATYTISVKNVIEQKITLNESTITMKKGTKFTWLDVTFKPKNTTDKSLTWKSSNKKIVDVNKKGVLNAKGIGKATITVTSANGKTANVKVSVTKYAVKVKNVSTISKKTIMEGEKITLPLEFEPVNATNQKVKWKSSDEDVATVNAKGVVTAKKAGKATITVTTQDGSMKSSKCVITVKELSKVTGVKVKSDKKKTVQLTWKPVDEADGYVIYMATSKDGKYQKLTTTKRNTTSYTKKKLTSKKQYYFKVSAIRKVGKKQYEGKFSDVKNVKVK